MPKVSIVIPVYNVENYLKECLNSLINQTFKDIEIICVNDGSTDNSLNILNEYSQNDNRIKVFNQLNSGAAIARNNGIKEANGEYLAILDADDIYYSTMIEKMVLNSDFTDADITICRCEKLDNKTKTIIPALYSIKQEYLPTKRVFCYRDVIDHVFDFCVGWSWDKLYKTNFIKENGLEFQNIRSTNDAYFVFMSLILAKKISWIDDILVTHRVNTNTQLSETREKDPTCFIQAIMYLQQDLIKRGLYRELEKSFLNWVVKFSAWQIKTLKNPKKQQELTEIVKKELFQDLKIFNKDLQYKKFLRLRTFDEKFNKVLKNIFSITNSEDKKRKIITIFGLKLKIKRRNNNIYVIQNGQLKKRKKIKGLKILFKGCNNSVYINLPLRFKNCKMILGNNNLIKLGKSNFSGYENVQFLVSSDDCSINIGENMSFWGGMLSLRNKPNTSIVIGNNCMFSSDVEIRTSDGHAIYDINTGILSNLDGDIVIGDNVWLSHGVSVLKGCKINSNIIVGTHSIVTKDCLNSNAIYVGIPAKLVKENVMWSHLSPEKYLLREVYNAKSVNNCTCV